MNQCDGASYFNASVLNRVNIAQDWRILITEFAPVIKPLLRSILNSSEDIINDAADLTTDYIKSDDESNNFELRRCMRKLGVPFLIWMSLTILVFVTLVALPIISLKKSKPLSGVKRTWRFCIESLMLITSCVLSVICVMMYWDMAIEVNKILQNYPRILHGMANGLQTSVNNIGNDIGRVNCYVNESIDHITMRIRSVPEEQVRFIERSLGAEFTLTVERANESLSMLNATNQFILDPKNMQFHHHLDCNKRHSYIRCTCELFQHANRFNRVVNNNQRRAHDADKWIAQLRNEDEFNELYEYLKHCYNRTQFLDRLLVQIRSVYDESYELGYAIDTLQRAKIDMLRTFKVERFFASFNARIRTAKSKFMAIQQRVRSGTIFSSRNHWLSINISMILILLPALFCIAFLTWLFLACMTCFSEMQNLAKNRYDDYKSATIKLLNIGLVSASALIWLFFLWALIFYVFFCLAAVTCNIAKRGTFFDEYIDNPEVWNGSTWFDQNMKSSNAYVNVENPNRPTVSKRLKENIKIAEMLDQCQRNETFLTILNLDKIIVENYFNYTTDINIDLLKKHTRAELRHFELPHDDTTFIKLRQILNRLLGDVHIELAQHLSEMDEKKIIVVNNACKFLKKDLDLSYLRAMLPESYDATVLYWSLNRIKENVDLMELLSQSANEKLEALRDTAMAVFFEQFNETLSGDLRELARRAESVFSNQIGRCNILSDYYNFNTDLVCEHMQYTLLGATLSLVLMSFVILITLFYSYRLKKYAAGTLNYYKYINAEKSDTDDGLRYEVETSRRIHADALANTLLPIARSPFEISH